MGACASKFTVLKNASGAPPPALMNEVESREVNPIEEVAVKKDVAAAVVDGANPRQSLGHLLSESEEKKGSAESNGAEVTPEAAVLNAPAQDQTENARVVDDTKLKGLEDAIIAFQNVAMEAETVKLETKEEVESEKPEAQLEKVGETLETEKVEDKPAEVTESDLEKPASDAEQILKKPEEPEVTEEQIPTSVSEKMIETSDKKPESPEKEKAEQKQAADTEKSETEEKPAEETEVETSDKVEDKHVLEPPTTESCSGDKTASDAEKPKAEEEKANSSSEINYKL